MMKRRTFFAAGLTLTGAGITLLVGCGRRSSAGRHAAPASARLGYLTLNLAAGPSEPFMHGLRAHGWVPGENTTIEFRTAAGQQDRLPALAAELVSLQVDVLIAGDSLTARPLQAATNSIPIVMTVFNDPVAQGLVESLARPGGNVTGLTNVSQELAGKRLALLKEVVPTIARVGMIGPGSQPDARDTRIAAKLLEVELIALGVRTAADFAAAFDTARREQVEALLTLPGPVANSQTRQIVAFAALHHLPTMFAIRTAVGAGGLLAYGPDIDDLYRRAAAFVDKLLRGAKPADLPVEQPSTFDFVINLQTANALGLTIPPSVLAQATEVIQ